MKFIKSLIAPMVVCFCIGTVINIGLTQNQSNDEMGYKEGKQRIQQNNVELRLKNNLKYPTID
jgi:hypothetical protein